VKAAVGMTLRGWPVCILRRVRTAHTFDTRFSHTQWMVLHCQNITWSIRGTRHDTRSRQEQNMRHSLHFEKMLLLEYALYSEEGSNLDIKHQRLARYPNMQNCDSLYQSSSSPSAPPPFDKRVESFSGDLIDAWHLVYA
jgi:hypothetical protein